MSFYGMNTDQAQDHSQNLHVAARRLEEVMGQVATVATTVEWVGPDAERFQDEVRATCGRADGVATELFRSAGDIQSHIEEQDRASGVDMGMAPHPMDGVLDWLGGIGHDLIDGLGRGIDLTGELVGGLLGGAGDIADLIGDGLGLIPHPLAQAGAELSDRIGQSLSSSGDRIRDQLGTLSDIVPDTGKRILDDALSATRDGEWGTFSQNTVDNLADGFRAYDEARIEAGDDPLRLADDRTGYADTPQPVAAADAGLTRPDSLDAIMQNTNASYGDPEQGTVSMSVIGSPSDPQGVIVNIPGTESWSPSAGSNPFDLSGNAALAGSGGTSAGTEATADAIRQLFEDQGIPAGTPIMLAGHSQGGMVAASLAGDEQFTSDYNITNVLTYGSPVDNLHAVEGVDQLNVQHRLDAVPRLDFGGNPGESATGTTVTLESPKPIWDAVGNHDQNGYRDSVAQQLQDPHSEISHWAQSDSMNPFLVEENSGLAVQHYQANVHRHDQ